MRTFIGGRTLKEFVCIHVLLPINTVSLFTLHVTPLLQLLWLGEFLSLLMCEGIAYLSWLSMKIGWLEYCQIAQVISILFPFVNKG